MDIARAAALDWGTVSTHRIPTIEFKRLFTGEPGTPENYELSLVRMVDVYTTPRHRHNYDQIRVPLSGPLNYAKGRDLPVGAIGYFPEGTPYGPQNVPGGTLLMGLQFGGASGQGMMSYDELRAGSAALSKQGRFEGGVYREDRAGSRVNKDGYEAVWEHVTGRELVYAKPRFEEPVVFFPDHFAWLPGGADGVAHRHLATFAERGVALAQWHLDPGATITPSPVEAVRLAYVMAGSGHIGEQPVDTHDAARLAPNETAALTAGPDGLLILTMDLPKVPTPVSVTPIRPNAKQAAA